MADWYKRYPTAFLMGTMGLTLEQKGAYSIILDLIYEKDGAIPDNDSWISGVMGVSARKWRALKSDLIQAEKITVENSLISNFRAAEELEKRSKVSRVRAESGAKGGRVVGERSVSGQRMVGEPGAKSLKNNNTDQAIASHHDALDKKRIDKKASSAKTFDEFWEVFAYKNGRAPSLKAWMKIEGYDDALFVLILAGAKREAAARPGIVARGLTPKMAQGWITDRRWEDEMPNLPSNNHSKWSSADWEKNWPPDKPFARDYVRRNFAVTDVPKELREKYGFPSTNKKG